MTKKKNKVRRNWRNRFSLVLMAIVISLVIAGITRAWTLTGNLDEWSAIFGSGSDNSAGGTTFGLIVPDTDIDFADDVINYNEIDPDAVAVHWVDCDETASSSATTGVNLCSYTNDTGNDMFVIGVGFVVTSSSAADDAVIDVEYGTASDTAGTDPNIFDDLNLGKGVFGSFDLASSYASAFSPFLLEDSSAIWASVTSGDTEEGIIGMFFQWTEPPSIIDSDLDS